MEIHYDSNYPRLIPIPELANGGYEKLSDEEKTAKLTDDFDKFLRRRAELVAKGAKLYDLGYTFHGSGPRTRSTICLSA